MTEPSLQHWILAAFAAALLHAGLLLAIPRLLEDEPPDTGGEAGITLELTDPFGGRAPVVAETPAMEQVSAQAPAAAPPTVPPASPAQAVRASPQEPAATSPRQAPAVPAEGTTTVIDEVRAAEPVTTARQARPVAPDTPSAAIRDGPDQALAAATETPGDTVRAAVDAPANAATIPPAPAENATPAPAATPEPSTAVADVPGEPPDSAEAESAEPVPAETLPATGEQPVPLTARTTGPAERVSARPLSGDTARREQEALRSYLEQLRNHLSRHREYPEQARAQREEGTALVTLVMDSGGNVIGYRLERSTGYASLDREAQAMIRRASPLPEPPGNLGRDRLTLRVPVHFRLEDP